MTVLELIKALSEMPPTWPVKAFEDAICDYDDIINVELNTEDGVVQLITQYGQDNG